MSNSTPRYKGEGGRKRSGGGKGQIDGAPLSNKSKKMRKIKDWKEKEGGGERRRYRGEDEEEEEEGVGKKRRRRRRRRGRRSEPIWCRLLFS